VVLPEVRRADRLARLRDRRRADRRAGVPDQAPAGPRYSAADRRVGFLRSVPRRTVVEGHRRLGSARRRGRPRCLGAAARLPARARAHVPRSEPRPARRRLPLDAGIDCDGVGRHRRQGLAERRRRTSTSCRSAIRTSSSPCSARSSA
jgi:hypothetical protein